MIYLWYMFYDLIFGLAVGFAASVTFGPLAMLCIGRTLLHGRIAGLMSGFGVALADTIFAAIALLFYSLIIPFIEGQMYWLAPVGGAVVIGLGLVIFLQKIKETDGEGESNEMNKGIRYLTSAFGVDIANFFTGIPYILGILTLVGSVMERGDNYLMIIPGFLIGAMLWWIVLTSVLGSIRGMIQENYRKYINKISGMIIILLGIMVIVGNYI